LKSYSFLQTQHLTFSCGHSTLRKSNACAVSLVFKFSILSSTTEGSRTVRRRDVSAMVVADVLYNKKCVYETLRRRDVSAMVVADVLYDKKCVYETLQKDVCLP